MATPFRSHRTPRTPRWALLAALVFLLPVIAHAQEEGTTLDTASKPISQTFTLEYDLVFRAVKTALERNGYTIGYASKKNRRIETEFRQLTQEDTFFDIMEKYGEIPYMRSPGWSIGRSQVFVNFASNEAGHTTATVNVQLSGYEGRFENRWIYWPSNGILEKEAMDSIVVAVAQETKQANGE